MKQRKDTGHGVNAVTSVTSINVVMNRDVIHEGDLIQNCAYPTGSDEDFIEIEDNSELVEKNLDDDDGDDDALG